MNNDTTFKISSLLTIISVVIAATVPLSLPGAHTAAEARGGGGGRGGFGGGFGRGGFDRGGFDDFNRDFDRGFDNGAFTPRDDAGYRTDDSPARNYSPPAVSEAELRAGADHDYGVLASDKGYGMSADKSRSSASSTGKGSGIATDRGYGLASDGGLGRVASAAAARGGGRTETTRLTPADLANRAQSVRQGFNDYNAFDRNWWNSHPGSWYYPGWRDGWAWGGVGWDDLSGYWGVDTEPVEYDYGNNITYQNDEVYYGTQPTASAATYYAQAQTLADSTPVTAPASATASDWKSLGVFSLTQGSQTNTTVLFQLAVNKTGQIRGNYYNALTQETKQVHGAVDKKDMRASWTVGTNKTVVYDTGLANLLKPQSTILVHLSKTQTEQWNLIKLNQPTSKS